MNFKDYANLDNKSQLCVGYVIGVNKDYQERAKAVMDADAMLFVLM